MRLFNHFTGLTPGLVSTIAYNEFSRGASLVDGAGVHIHIKPQNGALLYRNWAHDLVIKAFRFDRVNSASATWGVNGTVVENVVWRCAAACFKGDRHTIARNTVFDSSDEQVTAALFPMMYDPSKPWAIRGENAHTKLDHNAADSIFNVSGVLPGVHTGNVGDTCVRDQVTSPPGPTPGPPGTGVDFRPKDGTKMGQSGAGAFAHAASPWWVPGPRFGAKHAKHGGSAPPSHTAARDAGAPLAHSNVSCVDAASCRAYWGRVREDIVRVYGPNSGAGADADAARRWLVPVVACAAAAALLAVGLLVVSRRRVQRERAQEERRQHHAATLSFDALAGSPQRSPSMDTRLLSGSVYSV